MLISPRPAGKPRHYHRGFLPAQERLGMEGRIRQAFRMSAAARDEFKRTLRTAFPDLTDDRLTEPFQQRMAKWRNRNF